MTIVVIQQCGEPPTMSLVNEPASRAEKAFSCLINPQAESSTTSTSNYKQLTSPTFPLTNARNRRVDLINGNSVLSTLFASKPQSMAARSPSQIGSARRSEPFPGEGR